MARPPADYTDRRFGRLVALRRADGDSKEPHWLCRCDCGRELIIMGNRLCKGLTQCGNCLHATETKPCASCGKDFARKPDMSPNRWRQQKTCSRKCGQTYRDDSTQSRARSKAAMNAHWKYRNAKAANAARIVLNGQPSREAEEDAIARFIAERGVIQCEPAVPQAGPLKQDQVPQPMAGWRG